MSPRLFCVVFLVILPRCAFPFEMSCDPGAGTGELDLLEMKLASDREPASARNHNDLGIAYASAGLPYEAIAEFEKAYRISPGDAAIVFNLGIAHARIKNYTGALNYLQEAVGLCPDNAAAFFNLGVIHLDMGMIGVAQKKLERALFLSPGHPLLHYNLGIAYEHNEDGTRYGPGFPADKALQHYKRAMEGGLDNVAVRYNIGIILSKRGDYGKAIDEFTRACEFDPDFALARRGLALALVHSGKYHRAIGELEKAMASSDDPSLSLALALAYRKLGSFYLENEDYERALAQYGKALRHNKDDAVVYLNIGRIHSMLGNYDAALRDMKTAAGLDPELGVREHLAKTYFLKGIDLERSGFYRMAFAEYEKAVCVKRNFALAHLMMGELCADELGRKDEAVECFKRCLELDSNGIYSIYATDKISALTCPPGAGK